MPTADELRSVKRRVSPLLLRIPGVSGVGTPGGTLTVYLAEDSERTRREASAVLERAAPGVPVCYVVTGAFQARPRSGGSEPPGGQRGRSDPSPGR
jgi:hypothetical protein